MGKGFGGLLIISRTKQGARYFTDQEISLLVKIKEMRDKNLSKEMIRELLQKHLHQNSEPDSETIETSLLPVSENNTPQNPENSDDEFNNFLEAMEAFKESLLNEIKSEIRNTARKEILEEVKKKFQKVLFTLSRISPTLFIHQMKKQKRKFKSFPGGYQKLRNTLLKSSKP